MAFKFEELRVWQKALELTFLIHSVTLRFPKDEQFILTPQIKRAADSISLNIAEGSTGQTDSEFNRFLGYALRSAIEVIGCIYLAQKRNITTEIVKMIQALRNTLKSEHKVNSR